MLSGLVLGAFLMLFLPPLWVIAPMVALGLTYLVLKQPTAVIATILFLSPFLPLPLQGLKATGLAWVEAASSLKELGLVAAALVLAFRHGFKLEKIDFWLLGLVVWAISLSAIHPTGSTLIGLKDDFDFVIFFFVGRVAVISARWVKVGLCVAGFIATLGLIEFFYLGIGPRLLLLNITDASDLPPTFRADWFDGVRAGSTLGGPLEFGGFCAIVLLVFASLYREIPKKYILAAILVVLGLTASATRMAGLGLILGLAFIAIRTGQKRRFAALALGCGALMLLIVIPWMGFQGFTNATLSGQESSIEAHRNSLVEKTVYFLNHPLGTGAGTVGQRAAARNPNALQVESGYLLLGMEYGWFGLTLFGAFCGGLLWKLVKTNSNFGIAACAVGIAMLTMLLFSPIHMEFGLNSWAWLVIGFGIRQDAFAPFNAR